MSYIARKFFFSFVILLLCATTLLGQVTLRGKVTEKATGETLAGATIFIPDLKTGAATNSEGIYLISNLPKSTFLIQVSYVGYMAITRTVDLRKTTTADFEMSESAIEAQEVVVTGNALSSDNSQSSISITPIAKNQLLTLPSTNLINSIATVPGLSEITTGGAVSKPVIRGLSYNHVITLNEGVRQEGSQWGDEHGIEIDQFSADRIEVLKGPASLFYGSDAMGGVINILEPNPAPLNSVKGEMASQFSTGNKLFGNSLMAEGNQNGLIWRIRGTYKTASSFRTPAEYVYNSGFWEQDLSGMIGLNKRWGYSHLHFSLFDTKIGIIDGTRDSTTHLFTSHDGNTVTPDEAKSRDIAVPFQLVSHEKLTSVSNFVIKNSQIRINLGYQVNDRKEFAETPQLPGLYFHLDTWTGDAKYTLSLAKSLELVGGLSGMTQTNRNRGIEFLVPDYNLQDIGGFIYTKKSWERFTVNAGLRYDFRHVEGKSLFLDAKGKPSLTGDTLFAGFNADFSAVTGSAGMTFKINRTFNLKFNLGRGFRAPNIAELGSNGVHEGTFRYEIGNAALKPETSLQIDGELSANTSYLNAVFNGFYNTIDNFIYSRTNGTEKRLQNGIWYPVYRYIQGNSVLTGFELELDIHPVEALHLDNNIDYVYGINASTKIPLPFIPALHSQHDLKWVAKTGKKSVLQAPWVEAGIEIHYAQKRIDTFETETPGYVLLNASLGAGIKVQKQHWTLFISGKNLTDVKYYDHLSRLKPLGIYNMGRNITVGLLIPFGLYEGH
ncbi:MAG: TonB-dependent receptor [Bacteroidota bacterium]